MSESSSDNEDKSETESVAAAGDKRRCNVPRHFNKIFGYDKYIRQVILGDAKVMDNADYSTVKACQEALQKCFVAGLIDSKAFTFY